MTKAKGVTYMRPNIDQLDKPIPDKERGHEIKLLRR